MSHFEAFPEQSELIVRSSGPQSTSIRFFDWSRTDESEVVFAVEAVSDDLRACIDTVTVSVWDGAGDLSEFLDALARDFHGWEGERVWLNNHLILAATFGSGGHVHLTWTLRSGIFPESWRCSLTTTFEAGEEMATFAVDARGFLHQGQTEDLPQH
ncbi:DUF6228 family protein [Streptomyces roseoverticillatus]|uniref:DUF6228 family protein n=1 Tax=Streptomyces roseoverticillatus TaxID=66429 RepID=UPI0033FAD868